MRAERVRVLGGHMTSTYSEVAAGNQGTQQPQVVFLVTQDDCQRACTCVLVRQGVSVSALCNAALECHVCHPSPQLSGTADGPTTERERGDGELLLCTLGQTLL